LTHSFFNLWDHHIDVSVANVLFVELITSFLHVVLVIEEGQSETCLPALANLDYNVIICQVVVGKEVHYLLLSDFTGEASQLDGTGQVFLIQESPEVDGNATELVIHELLVLAEGHLVKLDPTGAYMLSIHLSHRVFSLFFGLKQDGGVASLSAVFQLTNLDGLADVCELGEELLDLLLGNFPG